MRRRFKHCKGLWMQRQDSWLSIWTERKIETANFLGKAKDWVRGLQSMLEYEFAIYFYLPRKWNN